MCSNGAASQRLGFEPIGLPLVPTAVIEARNGRTSATIRSPDGVEVDTATDVEFYNDGVELAGSDVGRQMFCASRPLFESIARRELAAVDGVALRGGCTVLDYLHDDRASAVEGVRIRDESGETTTLDADLVVDATGRTSRTPAWLAEHGYPEPTLDEVHIDVQYGTVEARRPPDDHRTVFLPASHPHRRGGLVVPVEDDR